MSKLSSLLNPTLRGYSMPQAFFLTKVYSYHRIFSSQPYLSSTYLLPHTLGDQDWNGWSHLHFQHFHSTRTKNLFLIYTVYIIQTTAVQLIVTVSGTARAARAACKKSIVHSNQVVDSAKQNKVFADVSFNALPFNVLMYFCVQFSVSRYIRVWA